jgi:hypothetical protein
VSFGRYLVGVAVLIVCVGALALGARRLRAWIAPSYEGVAGRVADTVALLALLTLTLELVGVIGVLELPGVVAGCLVVGGVAWGVGTRYRYPRGAAGSDPVGARRAPARECPTGAYRRHVTAVAIAGVSVVAAAWLGWTVFAYRHGMETIDTLWYHLPFAARFVQDHNIRHLQYFDGDAITVFYPANSELLHAFGIVVFGNDLLSPAIDLGWGAFALGCAWAIGRPWGREPHCLLAGLPVLLTPGLVDTQPGGAYDDIVCIALLLAAVALIVNGGDDRGGRLTLGTSAMAAIPAGMALGTKYTMIVPAIALGLGSVAFLGRGRRRQHAAIWAGGLILLGGYWYLRDAIAVGNPLPSLAHIGPISLPSPHTERSYTVWEYLTNGAIWRGIFIPGLRQSLGLAWWAVITGAFAGALLAMVNRRQPRLALIGGVALLSGFAFLVTPQLLGVPGVPFFFSVNVRYCAAPLILGLILLPLTRPLRHGRVTLVWIVASALMLLFTALDPGVWRSGFPVKPFAAALHGGPALAGAALGAVILIAGEAWLWRGAEIRSGVRRSEITRRLRAAVAHRTRRVAAAAAGVAAVLAALAGWLVGDAYAHDRYRDSPPLPVMYAWAQHVQHARIGIVGLTLQYPLTGASASNHVQYIGVARPHRGFGQASTCRQWRRAVDRGHYGWVLVTPTVPRSVDTQPAFGWTRTSPGARATLRQFEGNVEIGVLYRIIGPLDPATCPR